MIKAENQDVIMQGSFHDIADDFGFIIHDVTRIFKAKGVEGIDGFAISNLIMGGVPHKMVELYGEDPELRKEMELMVDIVVQSVNECRNFVEAYAAKRQQEKKDGLSGD